MSCIDFCAVFRTSRPSKSLPAAQPDNGDHRKSVTFLTPREEVLPSSYSLRRQSASLSIASGSYQRPRSMLYVQAASRRPSTTTLGPDDLMSLSDILLEGIQPPKVYKQRPASMQIFAYEEYPFLPSPIVRVPTQERVRFDGYDINQGRSSKYGDADGGDDVDPLCTTPANQMQEVHPRGRSVGISEGMDGDMHDGGSPGDKIVMPKTHTGLGITF